MATRIINIQIRTEAQTAEITKLDRAISLLSKRRQNLNRLERQGKITSTEAAAARSKLNLQLQANRNRLNDLNRTILQNNNALRQNSGFVAGLRKGLAGAAGSFLGVTAAVFGVIRILKNAGKIISDFQQANADLASVLGKERDQIKALTEDSKRLGASTKFTATEVAGLQKEFAKLGFTEQEILNTTEATLELAAATNTELAEAARVAGSTVKAFGLDASDTQQVVDVMAKSFSSSALDMEKFSTAMAVVAPVSAAAGVEIEEATSLIGILSDRGLDASTSGTSLRNIFLELAKQGITMQEAFERINTSTNKLSAANELFGKRGATAALILAENADQAGELEEKLNGAAGAAERMAEEQLDTLEGKLTILNSAWEGFILSIEDGEGVLTDAFEGATEAATGFLSQLTALNEFSFDDLAGSVEGILNALGLADTELAATIRGIQNVEENAARLGGARIKAFRDLTKEQQQLIREDSEGTAAFLEQELAKVGDAVLQAVLTGDAGLQQATLRRQQQIKIQLAEERGFLAEAGKFNEKRAEEEAALSSRSVEAIREEISAQKELLKTVTSRAAAIPIQQEIKRLEEEINKILGEGSKEAKKRAEQAAKEFERLAQAMLAGRIDILDQLAELSLASIVNAEEQAIAEVNAEFDAKLGALEGKFDEEEELRTALEAEQANQIALIRQDAREQELVAEREAAMQRAEIASEQLTAEQELADARVNAAQVTAGFIAQTFDDGSNAAKAVFFIERALAVAQVITSTTREISQIRSTVANIPAIIPTPFPPFFFPNPAFIVASGVAAARVTRAKVNAATSVGQILATGIAQVAAAGGGDFVTHGPALMLVGDNPGGRERVTVDPLSGTGKTRIDSTSSIVAMAGGGQLVTSPTASVSQPFVTVSNDMAAFADTIVSGINNKRVINNALETTRQSEMDQDIENEVAF